MAILSKIRERSMFLILVIGLALFAFVLDPSTLSDFFNSSKINQVGEVNGETISRQEFAQALENYQARTGNRVSEMQASKTVWNNLVREKLYETQLEQAGITIGEEDIMNALYQTPSVQNDVRFQSAGMFDKSKFLEYLADIKEDKNQAQAWAAWQNYISSIGSNLKRSTYDNLIAAGLGASLKEGESQYLDNNTNVSSQFVYVPYTTIPDSLITVKKSDIQSYINNHKSEFEVEASRDIRYVKFNVLPTEGDEAIIKGEVADLLEDNEEFASKGLKNTTDYEVFLEENNSDLKLDNNFKFKNDLFVEVSDAILSKNVGEVYGPYKDRGYYKISKVTEVAQLPDSVKANHILIPFLGSRAANAQTILIEEDAKKQADSILKVVKRNRGKFAELAKKFSADKSNSEKGGELGWFKYNSMVPEFRDYCFTNKKGDIGVVKSPFGFHVISIENQKNKQKVVKLATYARQITPSEDTESAVFQQSESFALDLSKTGDFDKLVVDKKLTPRPAVGIKALDENVPGLGNQRQIVSWAFGKGVKVGDFKRFDVDGGYVVVSIMNKTPKGLMPVEKATSRVRSIVANEKKASLIADKMKGATLADIAKENNQNVRTSSNVTLKSPTLSGVGSEPKIVGAMLNAKENELYKNVLGQRGVYAFVVTKKELPTLLPNYDAERNRIAGERRNKSFQMFEAIKKGKVTDNRSTYYGVE